MLDIGRDNGISDDFSVGEFLTGGQIEPVGKVTGKTVCKPVMAVATESVDNR